MKLKYIAFGALLSGLGFCLAFIIVWSGERYPEHTLFALLLLLFIIGMFGSAEIMKDHFDERK